MPQGSPIVPLCVTMGEPSGIGSEITLRAWRHFSAQGPCFFAIDDPERLARLSGELGLDVPIRVVADPQEAGRVFPDALPVLPLESQVKAVAGIPDRENAGAVLESISRSVALAQAGRAAGVVTNPIQKSTLYEAGFEYPGHTEYLAALTHCARPVMMLVSPALRVVPVTIHVPLISVSALLTIDLIVGTAEIVTAELRSRFGIDQPRMAIAGLNPHAGESGTLGREDQDVVAPAVRKLQDAGIDARGPLPADTMFHARARETYDVALCMYHDQALIPSKTLDFDGGVNVTLGLPIVRTSPDHGTALDIAGKGIAKPDSFIAAVALAAQMARRTTGVSADA